MLEKIISKLIGASAGIALALASPVFNTPAHAEDSKVIFVGQTEDGYKLHSMTPEGKEITQLNYEGEFDFYNSNFSISPDGTKVVYDKYDKKGDKVFHIYVSDLVNGTTTQLTTGNKHDFRPVWSHDGKEIIFSRQYGKHKQEVCTVKSDGNEFRKLTTREQTEDSWATYSADGEKIAFVSTSYTDKFRGNVEMDSAICIMDKDGTNVTEIFSKKGRITEIAWSPKGDRLAYLASFKGHFDVYTVDISGEDDPVNKTNYCLEEDPNLSARSITWTDDGEKIFFGSSRGAGHLERKVKNGRIKKERRWSTYDSEICSVNTKGKPKITNLTNNPKRIEKRPIYVGN